MTKEAAAADAAGFNAPACSPPGLRLQELCRRRPGDSVKWMTHHLQVLLKRNEPSTIVRGTASSGKPPMAAKTILILGTNDDEHALHVRERLVARGQRAILLDSRWFPIEMTVALD